MSSVGLIGDEFEEESRGRRFNGISAGLWRGLGYRDVGVIHRRTKTARAGLTVQVHLSSQT